MASDYKEYRPRTRIIARVLTDNVRVIMGIVNGEVEHADLKAGDYEIRAEDGSLSYQSKAEFDAANEPVRRERQVATKAAGKSAKKKPAAQVGWATANTGAVSS